MKMAKRLLIFCLIGSLFFAFSGVSLAAMKQPYRLGAVFSVTGRASNLGEPAKKTVDLMVEQINAAGGINGHPLEVIVYDDASDETNTRFLVTKLMRRDRVLAVLGPSLSGTSLAVVDLAETYKCCIVSCAASWMIVTDPETKKERHWVFKTPQKDSHAVKKIYGFMKHKGINRIAILTASTGFGASGRQELIRLAPSYGIRIVADERFGPKDADMTAQLKKIKASRANAIVGWTVGPTAVTIVKNWKALGMTNIPFFHSHGFANREYIKLAAGAAERVYCPLGVCNIARLLPKEHIQKKVTMEYTLAYKKKYGEPPSSFGGHAWDAMMLLVDALKAAGKKHTTRWALRKAVRDYLEKRKGFVGQHGVFNFSPVDHNGLTKDAFEMVVVKGSDWVIAR